MWQNSRMHAVHRSTWYRLVSLLVAYVVIPPVTVASYSVWGDPYSWPELTILLILLPLVTMVLAAWDGARRGYNVLWLALPVLASVVWAFIDRDMAWIVFGAAYGALGTIANALAAALTARSRFEE